MATTPTLWKSQTQVNTTDAAVGAGGGASQSDGQVMGLPDGGYLVVWTDNSRAFNSAGSAVVGQRYDALGDKVAGEFRISGFNNLGNQFSPTVTVLPDGGVVVAYVHRVGGFPDGSHDIFVTRLDASMKFVSNVLIDNSAAQTLEPSITSFADGSYVVSYTTGAAHYATGPNDTDIVARLVPAQGPVGPQFAIHDQTDNRRLSDVATLSNGNFVAVWHDQNNGSQFITPTAHEIYFGIFTPSGSVVRAPFSISERITGNLISLTSDAAVDVAALTGGGFVMTWRTGRGELFIARLNNAGDVTSPIFKPLFEGVQVTGGNVTGLSDGGFLITYEIAGEVRAQRFDAFVNKIGAEFMVNTTTSSLDRPSATVLSDGRIAFALTNESSGDADIVTSIWDPRTSPINGSNGNDTITSRRDGAIVNGLDGQDKLLGLGGADMLNGGAGNDTVVGGANFDTALFEGSRSSYLITSNPDGSFRIAANGGDASDGTDILSEIESFQFTTRDVGNQTVWRDYWISYDTELRATGERLNYDDGRYTLYGWDAANQATWRDYWINYDSLDRATAEQLNYDDGHYTLFGWDAANQATWSDYWINYDSLGRATAETLTYDSGHRTDFAWDAASQASWSDYWINYDNLGRATAERLNYDTGHRTDFAWDAANTAVWSDYWINYDNLGRATQERLNYDDGRSTLYGWDAANEFVWSSYIYDYDAQGKLISQSGVYDNGTTWLI